MGPHCAAAITGRPDGTDAVESGTLEVSADGTTFRELAWFADGTARGGPAAGSIPPIRIRRGPSDRPIAIRELFLDADPPVGLFRDPVEFIVDTSTGPDLKPWAAAVARACEHAYAMINDELGREGYRALRAGEYDDDLFRQITGKTVHKLDDEWRATLRR